MTRPIIRLKLLISAVHGPLHYGSIHSIALRVSKITKTETLKELVKASKLRSLIWENLNLRKLSTQWIFKKVEILHWLLQDFVLGM